MFVRAYSRLMLPVNPPGEVLGRENAVLSGRGARYYVPDFEGCLSIKSVVSGTAVWETEHRRFLLGEDRWLILNDRQHYTITIDALQPVTTFCLFFERGFVEEIYRAQVTPAEVLLDSPQPVQTATVEFITRIEPADGSVMGVLKGFHKELSGGEMTRAGWDERFLRIAGMVVLGRGDTSKAIARLPAIRHSTRMEVYRRLLRGRDFLLSSLHERIQLKDMAAAACLSPFHFHRSFTCAFGETPHQYLTRHRLERAAQLLRRVELSVTEICLATGFESPTSFSDLFRRHYGVLPSKFSKIQEAERTSPL
jgi:AraC family transcriptional regulator